MTKWDLLQGSKGEAILENHKLKPINLKVQRRKIISTLSSSQTEKGMKCQFVLKKKQLK